MRKEALRPSRRGRLIFSSRLSLVLFLPQFRPAGDDAGKDRDVIGAIFASGGSPDAIFRSLPGNSSH